MGHELLGMDVRCHVLTRLPLPNVRIQQLTHPPSPPSDHTHTHLQSCGPSVVLASLLAYTVCGLTGDIFCLRLWVGFVGLVGGGQGCARSHVLRRCRPIYTLVRMKPPNPPAPCTLMHPCANIYIPTPTQFLHSTLDSSPVSHACKLHRKPGS